MTRQNTEHFPAASHSGRFLFLFLALLLLPMGCLLGVASYFRLGSDARALRDSVFSTLAKEPYKTLDVNIGWATATAVRAGAGFFNLPREARAALESLRGVEAGVYTLACSEISRPERMLAAADAAMGLRRWERVAAVIQDGDLVAVYVSERAAARKKLKCCVLVVHERHLIVGSASGNLLPLVEMACEEFGQWHPRTETVL